jgi:hypothetical protein
MVPPPTGRSDAPPSLEHLLRQSFNKDPEARPPSAEAVGRALQDAERELQLSPTPFELRVDDPLILERRAEDEEGTRAAAPRTVAGAFGPSTAEMAPGAGGYTTDRLPSYPQWSVEGRTQDDPARRAPVPSGRPGAGPGADAAGEAELEPDHTLRRAAVVPDSVPAVVEGRRRRPLLVAAVAAVVALAVCGGVVAVLLAARPGPSAGPMTSTVATTVVPLVPAPAAPTNVTVSVRGSVAHVAWQSPGAMAGDRYRVAEVSGGQSGAFVQVAGRSATVRGVKAGTIVCFEVATVRAEQISSPSAPGCGR